MAKDFCLTVAIVYVILPNVGPVAQWQSRGLLSPGLQVRVLPGSPKLPSHRDLEVCLSLAFDLEFQSLKERCHKPVAFLSDLAARLGRQPFSNFGKLDDKLVRRRVLAGV